MEENPEFHIGSAAKNQDGAPRMVLSAITAGLKSQPAVRVSWNILCSNFVAVAQSPVSSPHSDNASGA
jgi:hypothetical protein